MWQEGVITNLFHLSYVKSHKFIQFYSFSLFSLFITIQMARAVWLYYMAKIVELLDTVFFVLRKKQSQVSFLHVYHHTLMPFCAFIGVKYFAGKLFAVICLILFHFRHLSI